MDLIRESGFGQLMRLITRNRVFLYPEENPGFTWEPLNRALAGDAEKHDSQLSAPYVDTPNNEEARDPEKLEVESGDSDKVVEAAEEPTPLDTAKTANDPLKRTRTNQSNMSTISKSSSRRWDPERVDTEVEDTRDLNRSKSSVIAPTKTADGVVVVSWYTTDDPANPQNWKKSHKIIATSILAAYSLAVYGSSSMYVSGEQQIEQHFHVNWAASSLGLAIFVIGYGIGPLLWAPLSEIPIIGRNIVYIPTFFLFVILGIPTALINNYGSLLLLRFLTGFFGSPCLANGGASIGDMFNFLELPIWLSAWTVACFWGPAIGPIITGFAVQNKSWRWGLWEIVWLSAPILVAFFFFYPETSADHILLRRAQRLRKLTGRNDIKSQSEIDQANMKPSEVVWDALIKPIEITIKDPAVLFTNLYTSLCYGIYYSFFEVFPLVYPPIYHFNLGETGLCFITIGIGCIMAVIPYLLYQTYYLIPDIKKNGMRAPEHRLVPAMFGVFLLPAGYFMFGWTARHAVHWSASLIGVALLVCANFWIFQSLFIYLPLSYPRYAASLFAANDLFRSAFAAGCVMFAHPMFVNLGIGGGVSLLAGLSCLGVLGMFGLYKYGAWLRSKSTFTGMPGQ